MDNNRPIIVPWDFSDLAGYALQHAKKIASAMNCKIVLLHIVKKSSEVEAAKEKMEAAGKELKAKYGIKPDFVIKEGSIFTDINRMIAEENALFAIMGTHGIKGMQKFTGSWALKVIVGSEAPFIVVQEPPASEKMDNIIFPVDSKFSEKEKLVWAELLYRHFQCTFHLCYVESSDPLFKKQINANMMQAQKFLKERNVQFNVHKLEGKVLYDEVLSFSEKINADMIMITTTKNISFHDYMLGASEQKMIANNNKIPVMTINPRKDLTKFKGFN